MRLNDDGTAPADNPFVGKAGYKPEIYALGFRNPTGLMIHPQTGELWDVEHGPQGGDEVNIIKAGRNYGWPVVSYGRAYSGDLTQGGSGPELPEPCAPGMEQPFLFWNPVVTPSGIALYTGDRFPAWKGSLFIGALRGNTHLQRVVLNTKGLPTRRERLLTELKQRIREVRQGPDGLLYLLSDHADQTDVDPNGALIRIEPLPEPSK
jgi:glucose/arabinose dehydrogenase